jgi:putative phosphoesterase
VSDLGEGEGELVIGVLSDTHGHLYPPVHRLLEGVDHIIHAGDIGSPKVLAELRSIAPVTAVRGNCDYDAWSASLPLEAQVQLGGVRILVGHIAGRLRETLAREQSSAAGPERPGIRVVVTGHTHRVESVECDAVLHINPGSAGPERFGHPRTMARLHITPVKAGPPAHDVLAAPGTPPARVDVELLIVPEA